MIAVTTIQKQIRPGTFAFLLLYSIALSASIIASNHIIIAGGEYSTAEINRISAYSYNDLALFALVTVLLLAIGTLVLALLFPSPKTTGNRDTAFETSRLERKPIILMGIALFVLYVPYLLAYWPGLIFSDSMASLSQSLGFTAYNNHHPLAFTLCVKACLFIAHMFGLSNSAGCALFSITQIALLSLCFATSIQWVIQRTKCHRIWRFALLAFFGLPPYFATYTIAMWKDPLFSAGILILSLLTFDLIASKGRILELEKAWLPTFILACLATALLRSNGILVILVLAVALIALSLKRQSSCKKPAIIATSIAIVALLVTGPVFSVLGVIPAAKAESIGVPLNQMARVAATDGAMSDDDARYLNDILPLDLYKTVYTPTCVDSLKWNPAFNEEALSTGFWQHWLSLGVKSPISYLESWELQTVGYWSVNQPQVLTYSANISTGVPHNTYDKENLEAWGIFPQNKLGNDAAYNLLRIDQGFIPIGWLVWFALFAALALFNSRKTVWAISLIPTAAIVTALLIASPIWYWERYAVALQFLLPFYVSVLICARNAKQPTCTNEAERLRDGQIRDVEPGKHRQSSA